MKYYNMPSLKSKTKEIDICRLTVLPDATSVTSSCMVTTSLQVLATKGKESKSKVMADSAPNTKDSVRCSVSVQVPAEELTVPDVTVPVSAVPDAPTLEAALQDVSCPASIMEI